MFEYGDVVTPSNNDTFGQDFVKQYEEEKTNDVSHPAADPLETLLAWQITRINKMKPSKIKRHIRLQFKISADSMPSKESQLVNRQQSHESA